MPIGSPPSRSTLVIVGVNDYVSREPLQIPILDMNPQGYEWQIQRLERVRHERDQDTVRLRLEQLRYAAHPAHQLGALRREFRTLSWPAAAARR